MRWTGADRAAFLNKCGAPRVIYSPRATPTRVKDLAAMSSLRAIHGCVFDMSPHMAPAEVAVLLGWTGGGR
ncbi:putative 23S rRNA methyluridine methyltransferase [Schaalia georgiae F0490]|uniref:Putative 23S rRNA methyluridine methyltransferase n=1 Tax=Schaalia georgiae F0490 TaxID=1125717 RepID=J1H0Z6_9ACTO|nr:putative 23S rRNA methyluridine methyltransferase [Schaalia georgiae F0490]